MALSTATSPSSSALFWLSSPHPFSLSPSSSTLFNKSDRSGNRRKAQTFEPERERNKERWREQQSHKNARAGDHSHLRREALGLGRDSTVSVVTPSVSRSFNTNVQGTDFNDKDRSVDVKRHSDRSVSRRRDSACFFSAQMYDPFSPTRSLSQVLNLMDQFTIPLISKPVLKERLGREVGQQCSLFRIEMLGLGKEDVKISVDQNTLIIRGEGGKESEDEDEDSGMRYSSRLDLPSSMYKVDEIKAEIKNGVLKVVVPKVKEEERKDV